MELTELFNQMPFVQHLGIEVTEASDGFAEARLPFGDHLRSHHTGSVAHGGATYGLADTTGGAAVISMTGDVTPTVDMRIEYLSPTTTDLIATAEVIRYGSSLAIAHVDVEDTDGTVLRRPRAPTRPTARARTRRGARTQTRSASSVSWVNQYCRLPARGGRRFSRPGPGVYSGATPTGSGVGQ